MDREKSFIRNFLQTKADSSNLEELTVISAFIGNFFQTEADSSNLEELTEISAFIGNFFQNIWKK